MNPKGVGESQGSGERVRAQEAPRGFGIEG